MQRGGRFGIGCQQMLVAAHPRVMVDVARLGQAHRGMNEQIGLGLLDGAQGQFLMGAMHGVTGLERHHSLPAQLGEAGAQLARRATQLGKIVMGGRFDTMQPTTDIDRTGSMQQMEHPRMPLVGVAEDLSSLVKPIGSPYVAHFQHRDQHALGIAQRHPSAAIEWAGELLGHVECDRYRP